MAVVVIAAVFEHLDGLLVLLAEVMSMLLF